MRFFRKNWDYISAVIYGTLIGLGAIIFLILYGMDKDIKDLQDRMDYMEVEMTNIENNFIGR